MKADLHELLSELEEAILLAPTLMDVRQAAPEAPERPLAPPQVGSLPPLPDLAGGFGTDLWSRALAWSLEATGSRAAFLVDPDGLVIATLGELDPRQVESLAPRLLAALEQLALMEQPFGTCMGTSSQLGSRWLTGFRIQLPGNLPLVLGLIGAHSVEARVREAFEGFLGQAFAA